MSQVLTIDGRDYIPAGRVGKHFGYTRDYILTLAREGKIDGQKIGHRWYVNLQSAEKYFSSAKVVREERRQMIREERRAELLSHAVLEKKASRSSAALEAVAIAIIGLVVGMTGYITHSNSSTEEQVALTYSSNASFLERLAVSLYNLISPEPEVIKTEVVEYVPPSDVDEARAGLEHDVASRTMRTSLVVGPGEILTTVKEESILESFSDEVSVSIDPHNPDTGIIIPHFKDADGEEYRYLIVPVIQENTQ
jgi:hypothetical protein